MVLGHASDMPREGPKSSKAQSTHEHRIDPSKPMAACTNLLAAYTQRDRGCPVSLAPKRLVRFFPTSHHAVRHMTKVSGTAAITTKKQRRNYFYRRF